MHFWEALTLLGGPGTKVGEQWAYVQCSAISTQSIVSVRYLQSCS